MTNLALAHNVMETNGLQCCVNLPKAPEGEGTHRLPPNLLQPAYKVDQFPACPTNWMNGSDKASSYFFPVGKGKHLWLDFNRNWSHTHHVAIVLSVQGINPVTNQPSKVLRLEQYREKCPVHKNESFKQDRYCEKCAFKWPSQNYLTTVSTPHGLLWVDGWRTESGTIRGFLITADTMKGIANQMIGEDRVWAIGAAFYLSKEPKPVVERQVRTSSFNFAGGGEILSSDNLESYQTKGGGGTKSMSGPVYGASVPCSTNSSRGAGASGSGMLRGATKARRKIGATSTPISAPVDVEKLEIAAGAKIDQELAHHDPSELDFYQDEPAGVIYCNYCTSDDFEKIVAAGARDMTKGGEGALAGLNVGNDPAKV